MIRIINLFFLICFLVVIRCQTDSIESDKSNSSLIILNYANIDENLSHGDWFINFHAPSCRFSKSLEDTWELLATITKGRLNVAKVDCTNDKQISRRFVIKSFPSLLFFSNNQMWKYKGKRQIEAFLDYIDGPKKDPKPIPPPLKSKLITLDSSNFEKRVKKGNWFVAILDNTSYSRHALGIFNELRETVKGIKLATVSNLTKSQLSKLKVDGYPSMRLFQKGSTYVYRGPHTEDDLLDFLDLEPHELQRYKISPTLSFFQKIAKIVKDSEKWAENNFQLVFGEIILASILFGIFAGTLFTFRSKNTDSHSKQD